MQRTERSFDLHEVADALRYLNESERETWVRMAMAIKSEFGDAGFSVWDDWSQGYAKYKARDAKAVWRSCRASGAGGAVTLGTLIHEARAAGWTPAELSDTERTRLDAESAARRVQVQAQQEAAQARAASMQAIVARNAQEIWQSLGAVGKSPYLGVKKVQAHGIRFFNAGLVVLTDEDLTTVDLIRGREAISAFFARPDREELAFMYCKPGAFAVPMYGVDGLIQNLQVIFPTGKKRFMAGGRKQACWHLLAAVPDGYDGVLVIAEGYSTGASIYQAAGYPVAVAFDAGNLLAAGRGLRARYPQAQLVFAADDDRDTDGNPGITKAQAAAAELGGVVVWPVFGVAA